MNTATDSRFVPADVRAERRAATLVRERIAARALAVEALRVAGCADLAHALDGALDTEIDVVLIRARRALAPVVAANGPGDASEAIRLCAALWEVLG